MKLYQIAESEYAGLEDADEFEEELNEYHGDYCLTCGEPIIYEDIENVVSCHVSLKDEYSYGGYCEIHDRNEDCPMKVHRSCIQEAREIDRWYIPVTSGNLNRQMSLCWEHTDKQQQIFQNNSPKFFHSPYDRKPTKHILVSPGTWIENIEYKKNYDENDNYIGPGVETDYLNGLSQ